MGIKTIETRSWPTTHRGLLYIHASKTYSKEGEKLWNDLAKINAICVINTPTFEALPRGVVIGSVIVEGCLLMTEHLIAEQIAIEKMVGDFKVGRFAWLCSQPKFLDAPIPAKGSLQLWDFDPNAPQPVPVPSQSQLFAIGKSSAQRRRRRKKQMEFIQEMRKFAGNETTDEFLLERIPRKFNLNM